MGTQGGKPDPTNDFSRFFSVKVDTDNLTVEVINGRQLNTKRFESKLGIGAVGSHQGEKGGVLWGILRRCSLRSSRQLWVRSNRYGSTPRDRQAPPGTFSQADTMFRGHLCVLNVGVLHAEPAPTRSLPLSCCCPHAVAAEFLRGSHRVSPRPAENMGKYRDSKRVAIQGGQTMVHPSPASRMPSLECAAALSQRAG